MVIKEEMNITRRNESYLKSSKNICKNGKLCFKWCYVGLSRVSKNLNTPTNSDQKFSKTQIAKMLYYPCLLIHF